jgi:hypothetical protein
MYDKVWRFLVQFFFFFVHLYGLLTIFVVGWMVWSYFK